MIINYKNVLMYDILLKMVLYGVRKEFFVLEY